MTGPGIEGSVAAEGYAIVPDAVPEALVARLSAALSGVTAPDTGRAGVRNLLEAVPEVQDLARSAAVRRLVSRVLGDGCFAVRGLLFDKTAAANWKVAWHQDVAVAVRARRQVAGFGPWSEKAGVTHVRAPASLLGQMLAVRLHLDDCGPDSGPVRVVPGSHRAGRLSPSDIDLWRRCSASRDCLVPRGGLLLMRPLLLHASSAARVLGHRRVVHVEFAAAPLPGGLEWHGQW